MKTAIEIRDAIAAGEMTAIEALTESLEKIKLHDKNIGAFLELFEEHAIAQAKKIDSMKEAGEELPRLAGVPIAIKDNMCFKGHIASACAGILKEHVAAYHATVVEKLIDAGAVIVGRTNMDDAAMGSSTETSFYQKTYNPWNTEKVPGGSSGGSAAAVAAGFVPVALGSDTGGSIRQPAALCGVTGMKTTRGLISRYGLLALASSLDVIGPIARTVQDVALVTEVISGADEKDATTYDSEEKILPELLPKTFEGMIFGVPKEFFIDGLDPEIESLVKDAIELIKENGGQIKEVSFPLAEYALPAYYIIQPAEASSNLARYDGMRYGTRAPGALLASYQQARGEGFGKEVKRRIMLGTYILSAGYYDAYYKKAIAVKTALAQQLENLMKEVDLLVAPTAPSVAWGIGEKFDDPIAMYLADVLTVTANITESPAISVPCGFAHDLPVGLQFMGAVKDDFKVLKAAAAYQSLTDWHEKMPEMG